METAVAFLGITGLGVMIWAVVLGVRRRRTWDPLVRKDFWWRFGSGYAAMFLALLLDPAGGDAALGFLMLTGIGLIIWSGAFAARHPHGWDRAVTRGFAARIAPGAVLFVVGLALLPPTEPATQVVADPEAQPAATAPPSATPDAPPAPALPPAPLVPAGVPAGVQRAVVVSVEEGARLRVTAVDEGALPGSAPRDVRLLHVRPIADCFRDESTAELNRLAPVGSVVWLLADVQPQDAQGLDLRYLWNDRGEFVNADLVGGGAAAAEFMPPNALRWAEISAAGERAESAAVGAWSVCGAARESSTAEPSPQPNPQPNPEPKPRPNPQPAPSPTSASDDEDADDGNADDGGVAYYPNCKAAKAAGAAPLHVGDPGYRPGLDRDGDGVACET
ncbi:excalibur calcium-binding domain-containing protein [Saccharopolyspora sp. NPDC047091]|uniref:excalibur calcium-binding domain-containing protein n=1 Tax=Saccharopolyspora sp. NPDC047091 TaxID=3155924 RepID=UPI00340022A1